MKRNVLVMVSVLVLTFVFTLTVSATKPAYFSGFFYGPEPGYHFCFATGEYPDMDGFMFGCGYYTNMDGVGWTANWEGTVDGKSGTCVIHARTFIKDKLTSQVATNQCTGDLAGFHVVGDGDFYTLPFTWEGWYHWEK